MQYQDEKTKLFYQLVDMPELEGNYLETSGSAMIAYAILKAAVWVFYRKKNGAGEAKRSLTAWKEKSYRRMKMDGI